MSFLVNHKLFILHVLLLFKNATPEKCRDVISVSVTQSFFDLTEQFSDVFNVPNYIF